MPTNLTALTRRQWPLGWNPSADPINGDPTGLLRMDNLRQDEVGVLTLVKGIQQVNQQNFANYPDQIYSKNINGYDSVWVADGPTAQQVLRSAKGDFSDTVNLGAGTATGCFGDCLGEVLCLAGNLRIKDNLTTPRNLGLQTPGQPTVSNASQPVLNIVGTGAWDQLEGSINATGSGSIYSLVDATTLRGISELPAAYNTFIIDGGSGVNPANDIFQFNFIPDDSSACVSVTVTITLNESNYYQYTWDNSAFNPGPQQTTILTATRSQFTRVGTIANRDWTNITSITFAVVMTSIFNYSISSIGFYGGVQGALNGVYTWIQVNKTNNGFYLATSPAGPPTNPVTVINGFVTLTPANTEADVNEVWFYRTTVAGSQVGNQDSFLDQYYLTAQTTPGSPVYDMLSDDDAIIQDEILNPFLLSLQPLTDGNGVTEAIYAVEGLYNGCMLYMSLTSIYISDQLDPDAVDSRYTLRVSGDPTEFNVWLKKLTNNVLILGTSKNTYEISGTLLPLPDGTVDATIIAIGENYPPIGVAGANAVAAGGSIFYVAADGVRATSGSNSQLISPQLNLLFQGENRSGVSGVVISPFARYAIGIGKGRLFVALPLMDGSRQLFIYDLITQVWRLQYTDPISLFITLTDRVLLGYNTSTVTTNSGNMFELDAVQAGGFYNQDGVVNEGYQVYFQTVFDDNGAPNNRKDTFTLKVVIDTGGFNHSVYIAPLYALEATFDDPVPFFYIGNINTDGPTTVYFPLDLSDITLAFKYAIKIVDVDLTTRFTLYELTIDYDPRPEQVDFYRIQPDNLGTISRKRFITYAFVIDTLGNNITFTPIIDNGATTFTPANLIFSTQVKQTVIFYFTEEVIGTDISGMLSGGVFEFYGLDTNEIVSEKLPVPAEYLVIPANNFGEPNRKRHSSYKFQIITRGKNVSFTPIIDGVSYPSETYNTTEKRTVEYFFDADTIGIDIGGILQSLESTPFEFYGVIVPQTIEVLPARLQYYRIPNTNFGVESKKRLRTIPFVLNTNGFDVSFTPIIDGGAIPEIAQIFNTTDKITCYFYFTMDTDSFCTDFGAELLLLNPNSADNPQDAFEFYALGEPFMVEELPIPRMYDQLGPVRFDKIGKILGFRVRLIIPGNGYNDVNLKYAVYGDTSGTVPFYGTIQFEGTIPTIPGLDNVYEVQFPKSVNSDMFRLVLGPSDNPFYRFDVQVRESESGMATDSKWVPIR
jgi:hypothetical protein